MEFKDFNLAPEILAAVADMGYAEPTPIQQQALPPVIEGRDLLGCAQTGTGKTAAFALPILHRLHCRWDGTHRLNALILTPTRELALQIYENFCAYGKNLPLKSCVIFGGVSQNPQTSQLKAGADVLIATPGRLLDLMGQGFISLKQTDMFVLDEADRMLDMGFIPDVRRIAAKLPAQRQTLLFSATMPGEIARLAQKMLRNPVEINVSPISRPVELIEQRVYLVDKENKANLLAHLVKELPIPQALVFTRTKHGADRVARRLNREGVSAQAIHGDKSQSNRQRALQNFKDWKIQVLVATDIAARGIDIVEMPCVVNYDMPTEPETYVHRIGRTGRAGQSGMAISFCDEEEKAILRDVEMVIDKLLDIDYDNPFPLGSYVPDPNSPPPSGRAAEAEAALDGRKSPESRKGKGPKRRRLRRGAAQRRDIRPESGGVARGANPAPRRSARLDGPWGLPAAGALDAAAVQPPRRPGPLPSAEPAGPAALCAGGGGRGMPAPGLDLGKGPLSLGRLPGARRRGIFGPAASFASGGLAARLLGAGVRVSARISGPGLCL